MLLAMQLGDKASASIKLAAPIKSNRSIEEVERFSTLFESKHNIPIFLMLEGPNGTPANVTGVSLFSPANDATNLAGGF